MAGMVDGMLGNYEENKDAIRRGIATSKKDLFALNALIGSFGEGVAKGVASMTKDVNSGNKKMKDLFEQSRNVDVDKITTVSV
jgi:hypothetical protein